jgi:hypothetical protein
MSQPSLDPDPTGHQHRTTARPGALDHRSRQPLDRKGRGQSRLDAPFRPRPGDLGQGRRRGLTGPPPRPFYEASQRSTSDFLQGDVGRLLSVLLKCSVGRFPVKRPGGSCRGQPSIRVGAWPNHLLLHALQAQRNRLEGDQSPTTVQTTCGTKSRNGAFTNRKRYRRGGVVLLLNLKYGSGRLLRAPRRVRGTSTAPPVAFWRGPRCRRVSLVCLCRRRSAR